MSATATTRETPGNGTDTARKAAVAAETAQPGPEPIVGNDSPIGIGFWVVALALLSGLATGLILTGLTPIVPTNDVVLTTLSINFALIIAMLFVVGGKLWTLWRARRARVAGSHLHARIVTLFSIVAIVPSALLAMFAWISLDRGLDDWFSTRTQSIIRNSLVVAESYVQEHGQVLRSDVLAMARDLDSAENLSEVRQLRLTQQAGLRDLPFAYLLDEKGNVVETAVQSTSLQFLAPPPAALIEALGGDPVIIAPGRTSRVAALKRLENNPSLILYAARLVDPRVLRHLANTQAGVEEYSLLEARRVGVQIAFGLMYLTIALTMLLAAVWIGLRFANGLVAPIQRLIGAAEEVSRGDLAVQVPLRKGEGDLKRLSSTFNRMTSQLRIQRDELVTTNDELSERRRFIEAVLSGVSAGVIGLEPDGRITLVNRGASNLLGRDSEELHGLTIADALPEFAKPIEKAMAPRRSDRGQDRVVDQVTIRTADVEQILAVQVTREGADDRDHGYVVTFDDISELVAAQRTSAWADVARRIAHEIKNPLTPIQLSAERLKRKYAKEISSDPEVFDRCTETIIRQVGDLRRMVDEFSSFARMPDPVMAPADIADVAREVTFLFQNGHPEIAFEAEVAADGPVTIECDRRMLNQVLTNLVKNATEGIAAVTEGGDAPDGYQGRITVSVRPSGETVKLEVTDNGCGLPKKNRRRLVEPYMTTRAKGTGVGLAIVKKAVEQHHGTLQLGDAPPDDDGRSGARISIVLPVRQPVPQDETSGDGPPPGDAAAADAGGTSVPRRAAE